MNLVAFPAPLKHAVSVREREVARHVGLGDAGFGDDAIDRALALKFGDCHGAAATRLDWKALGYRGDPQKTGGRKLR